MVVNEILRILRASRFTWLGLKAAFQNEPAFRTECVVFLAALPVAPFLARSATELTLLLGSIVLLMMVELINSAIETVVDRIGPERNELSGRAKDMASAAVGLCIFLTAAVWLSVVIDRFF